MITATDQKASDHVPSRAVHIFERDDWECQACGRTIEPGERAFATLIKTDCRNPEHVETRCEEHHVEHDYEAFEEYQYGNSYVIPDEDEGSEVTEESESVSGDDRDDREYFVDRNETQLNSIQRGGIQFCVIGLFPFLMIPPLAVFLTGFYMFLPSRIAEYGLLAYIIGVVISPVLIALGIFGFLVVIQISIWIEPPNGLVYTTYYRVKNRAWWIGSKIR